LLACWLLWRGLLGGCGAVLSHVVCPWPEPHSPPLLSSPPQTRLKALECLEACLLQQPPPSPPPPSSDGPPLPDPSQAARALLSSKAAAPLSGALIIACLDAAEAELAAGPSGARAVRAAALRCARAVLLAAAGNADALAFFLPGLVSGFSKQLLASGRGAAGAGQSGAAAGASAAVAALEGLTDTIVLVLGDAAIRPVLRAHPEAAQQLRAQLGGAPLDPAGCDGAGAALAGAGDATTEQALRALERLSIAAAGGGNGGDTFELDVPPKRPPERQQQQQQQPRPEPGKLQITRDTEWLVSTSRRVQTLLAVGLTPLMTHPRPSVRLALARAAARLLDGAPTALHGSWQALTEVVLTLAQDDWPQVSGFAARWLATRGGSDGGGDRGGGASAGGELVQLVGRLALELLPAVRAGAEAGALAARRLTTALLCSGAPWGVVHLLADPASRW